jgi:hypothetical protein
MHATESAVHGALMPLRTKKRRMSPIVKLGLAIWALCAAFLVCFALVATELPLGDRVGVVVLVLALPPLFAAVEKFATRGTRTMDVALRRMSFDSLDPDASSPLERAAARHRRIVDELSS